MSHMNRKAGRPPKADPRRHLRKLLLNDAELATLENAAKAAGMDLGPYIREKALAAAKRTPKPDPT